MVFCKSCGMEIADVMNTKYCPKCGYSFADQNSTTRMAAGYNPYKNPTTAALIAIIGGILGILGIGHHIYAGKIGRGIFILVGGFILFILGILGVLSIIGAVVGIPLLIVYAIVWIWQIFDARSVARRFNELVQANGREPW